MKISLDKRKSIYFYIFSLIFSTQLVLGYFLQYKNVFFDNLKLSLLEIGATIIISLLLFFIVILADALIKNKNKNIKENVSTKSKFLKYFCIILICWLPAYVAFFPGIFSYDAPFQLYAKRSTMMHHPFLHTMLIKGCFKIGEGLLHKPTIGLVLYTTIQALIMAFVFAYTTNYLNKKYNNKTLNICTIIFYALFPLNQLLPLISTKDVLFAGFTLIALVRTIELSEKEKMNFWDIISLTFLIFLSISFRKNAFYAYLIFVFLYKADKNNKIIKAIFVTAMILYLIFEKVTQISVAKDEFSFKEKCSVFVQSNAAIKKYENITEEEREAIDKFYNVKNIEDFYKEPISDNVKNQFELDYLNEHKAEFVKLSLKLYFKYFKTSLKSTLNTTRGYWYINDKSFNSYFEDDPNIDRGALEIYCTKLCDRDFYMENREFARKEHYAFVQEGHRDGVTEYNFIPFLKKAYTKLYCENYYEKIPGIHILTQPATYFYVVIVYLMIGIYRKNRRMVNLGLFYILYFATCFLGPVALIRYVYVVIVGAPLMIGEICVDKSRKNG